MEISENEVKIIEMLDTLKPDRQTILLQEFISNKCNEHKFKPSEWLRFVILLANIESSHNEQMLKRFQKGVFWSKNAIIRDLKARNSKTAIAVATHTPIVALYYPEAKAVETCDEELLNEYVEAYKYIEGNLSPHLKDEYKMFFEACGQRREI